jgi:Ca2+-transporting ATPase
LPLIGIGESPLSIKLESLGKKLGFASLGVSIIVFIVGVASGQGADPNSSQPVWLQMLLVAISLTVAAVPEGLPACVTITLAVGMRRMVAKNALIRNLKSVETLGSATVICTDKTGTLTKGEMTCKKMWMAPNRFFEFTGIGYQPQGKLLELPNSKANSNNNSNDQDNRESSHVRNPSSESASSSSSDGGFHLLPPMLASLSSNAVLQKNEEGEYECHGNLSERPLVVAAAKTTLSMDVLLRKYKRLRENAFNSSRKMMSVLLEVGSESGPAAAVGPACFAVGTVISAVKGAPNIILDNCTGILTAPASQSTDVNWASVTREMTKSDRRAITNVIDDWSDNAYRVLAIAVRVFTKEEVSNPDTLPLSEMESSLVFVGLFASIDPYRTEVPTALLKAFHAGVRVVMITGDYVKTGKAVAESIGLIERHAAKDKAIDCEVLREWARKLADVEGKLSGDKPIEDQNETKQDLLRLQVEFQEKIDAITANADVYARAQPMDKITIVKSLQRQGHVCAMTGDGVRPAKRILRIALHFDGLSPLSLLWLVCVPFCLVLCR